MRGILARLSVPVGLVVLGFLGLWIYGRFEALAASRDAALDAQFTQSQALWQRQRTAYTAVLKASEAVRTERDALARLRAVAASQALQARLESDSLSLKLRSVLTGADSLPVLVGLVASLSSERDSWKAISGRQSQDSALLAGEVSRWKGMADSLLVAGDSVSGSAVAEHKARACRVVFVPCPSRLTAFLGGATLGAVTVLAVTR